MIELTDGNVTILACVVIGVVVALFGIVMFTLTYHRPKPQRPNYRTVYTAKISKPTRNRPAKNMPLVNHTPLVKSPGMLIGGKGARG
jgi:hypothetical protein